MKNFLRSTLGLSGRFVVPLMRRLDSSVTIFLLHDVGDEAGEFTRTNDIWVSAERFRSQMEFVGENFNVISMEALLSGDVPKRAALVTFDDGYVGTFKYGVPMLSQMGLPSTVFVNMAPVFQENYWAEQVFYLCDRVQSFREFLGQHPLTDKAHPQLSCTPELLEEYERQHGAAYLSGLDDYISPYVSAEELAEADEDPLLTLGSHLYTHYNVRNLSDSELASQYRRNFDELTKFKSHLPVFAFPFGHPESCFSMEQAAFLLNMGAGRLFTSWPQPNFTDDARVLDRIALLQRHERSSHIWFQVLKGPMLDMIGRSAPRWAYPQDEWQIDSTAKVDDDTRDHS